MKKLVIITTFLITLFFATYFLTGFVVDKLMGDEVYGAEVGISTQVEALKVKPNFGVQNQQEYNEQPAFNIHKLEESDEL